MRSLLLLAALATATFTPADPSSSPGLEAADERVEFRLRNDTGASVDIHAGTSETTISNGSSARYRADVGHEFFLGRDGTPDQRLFAVTAEMDGATLDLSDYV